MVHHAAPSPFFSISRLSLLPQHMPFVDYLNITRGGGSEAAIARHFRDSPAGEHGWLGIGAGWPLSSTQSRTLAAANDRAVWAAQTKYARRSKRICMGLCVSGSTKVPPSAFSSCAGHKVHFLRRSGVLGGMRAQRHFLGSSASGPESFGQGIRMRQPGEASCAHLEQLERGVRVNVSRRSDVRWIGFVDGERGDAACENSARPLARRQLDSNVPQRV